MRLAIVTGTSAGIGLACARALLEAGWHVIGCARRDAPIDHAAYTHHRVDLTDIGAFESFRDAVLDRIHGADGLERLGLVNNAALMGALRRMREADVGAFAPMLTVNVAVPVALAAAFVKQRPDGVPLRIVNVSSGAAQSAYPGLGDYCATKAGLRIAGQTLAAELEQDGVAPADVALLSYEPGLVETNMQKTARSTDPGEFPGHDTFKGFVDQGVLVEPAETVVGMVDFLASDPSTHFTETRFEGA